MPPEPDELVPERSSPETVRARLTAPVELRCRSPLPGPLSYTWTKSDGPMPAGLVTSQVRRAGERQRHRALGVRSVVFPAAN